MFTSNFPLWQTSRVKGLDLSTIIGFVKFFYPTPEICRFWVVSCCCIIVSVKTYIVNTWIWYLTKSEQLVWNLVLQFNTSFLNWRERGHVTALEKICSCLLIWLWRFSSWRLWWRWSSHFKFVHELSMVPRLTLSSSRHQILDLAPHRNPVFTTGAESYKLKSLTYYWTLFGSRLRPFQQNQGRLCNSAPENWGWVAIESIEMGAHENAVFLIMANG